MEVSVAASQPGCCTSFLLPAADTARADGHDRAGGGASGGDPGAGRVLLRHRAQEPAGQRTEGRDALPGAAPYSLPCLLSLLATRLNVLVSSFALPVTCSCCLRCSTLVMPCLEVSHHSVHRRWVLCSVACSSTLFTHCTGEISTSMLMYCCDSSSGAEVIVDAWMHMHGKETDTFALLFSAGRTYLRR